MIIYYTYWNYPKRFLVKRGCPVAVVGGSRLPLNVPRYYGYVGRHVPKARRIRLNNVKRL